MFNSGDLFVSLVIGLAMPLAILDGLRAVIGPGMPVQHDGFQIETRLAPWLLALLAGPGLLLERLVEAWHRQALTAGDLSFGVFIVLGWAGIYGYVVLGAVASLALN